MLRFIEKEYGGKKPWLQHLAFNIKAHIGLYAQFKKPMIGKSRLVFVCSGNICRSAMAHAWYETICSSNVDSIGLNTLDGKPANARFSSMALRVGVDLSLHRAKKIESLIPSVDDLFVCMEIWQCIAIRTKFPAAQITLLGLWLNRPRYYIHDPYSACEEYAERCAYLVKEAVSNISIEVGRKSPSI